MATTLDPDVRQIILDDALPYELDMLEETFLLLQNPQPRGVGNALIEFLCLHARQLIDFFENGQGVHAEQLTAAGTYIPQDTPAISNALRTKLNTQIAHLTAKRTSVEADKIGEQDRELLLRQLVSESQRFANQLSTGDRAIFEAKYKPRIIFVGSGGPSATSA